MLLLFNKKNSARAAGARGVFSRTKTEGSTFQRSPVFLVVVHVARIIPYFSLIIPYFYLHRSPPFGHESQMPKGEKNQVSHLTCCTAPSQITPFGHEAGSLKHYGPR